MNRGGNKDYKRGKTYEISRRYNLKKKFGMTTGDYDEMLAKQDFRCAICGDKDPKTQSGVFTVDHNHDTMEVRGLLCNLCNRAIGLLSDDAYLAYAAARYLDPEMMGGV
jgi:hypothetical protein